MSESQHAATKVGRRAAPLKSEPTRADVVVDRVAVTAAVITALAIALAPVI